MATTEQRRQRSGKQINLHPLALLVALVSVSASNSSPCPALGRTRHARTTPNVLNDPEQHNQAEHITTTPEHPFYVKERSDQGARPKPVGHDDLNSNTPPLLRASERSSSALGGWVGAGHLKIGDKIKQADGTIGVVANVTTVQQTQEMFNLTVDEAHTFYVGNDGWLVHNGSSTVDPKTIFFSQDSASWKFRDGGNISQLIDGLKTGAIDPTSVEPIRLVEKDGKLFTLDNRRLYAYQQAGIDVPSRMATPDEISRDAFKFTTKNGGVSIRIRGLPCD